MDTSKITEGNFVVMARTFDIGNNKVICVQRDTIVHFGKLHFYTDNLIGCDYGSVFEIVDERLEKIQDFDSYNNNLCDSVSTKLSTFAQKSLFSQEKIIKKKKKQNFANVLTVMKPKLDLLHEMLYTRGKLGGLRIDSLAQILSLGNIQNGSKCLILDHNLGIVTAAVMSRCLPDGQCVQLMPNIESVYTTRHSLNMLNIKQSEYKNNLFAITIKDAYKVLKNIDCFSIEENLIKAKDEMTKSEKAGYPGVTNNQHSTLIERDIKRQNKSRERYEAAKHLKTKSMDSLIIVVQNDHPLQLLQISYNFIAPSRPFVIFSDKVEPLIDCAHYLKSNSLAISITLSESWLRRYQVLPDRTRPEMNTTGYGGYILTGTKIMPLSSSIEINPLNSMGIEVESNSEAATMKISLNKAALIE